MIDELAQLIQLQNVDSELMELEALKGDLPEQVESLKRELEELEENSAGMISRSAEIELEKRKLQGEIDDARTQQKKYQEQLLLVSTNRAYDALMHEIDGTKQLIDNGELRILEIDDEAERLADDIKANEITSKEKHVQLTTQKASLKKTIAETEEQTRSLESDREKLVPGIDSRHYRSYQRIRGARDGIAVVSMSRGSCGSCYNILPPQKQVNIRGGKQVITCDQCGVVLFHEKV